MNGREFVARVRKLARKRGIAARFDETRGKGSHGTIYFGSRWTIVKDRKKDLGKGLLHKMLRDLGIDSSEL